MRIRVVMFRNGTEENGKVFPVNNSLEDLLTLASVKFSIKAKRLFTSKGGEIDDVELLRDDEVLYVSEGEDFIVRLAKCSQSDEWVHLNVGGRRFSTKRSTLLKDPNSKLAMMIKESMTPANQDAKGAYLIDIKPETFACVLNQWRGQFFL